MNQREIVALGALSFGVGKFWQRTEQDRELFSQFSPGTDPGGDYLLWSALFLRVFVAPYFPEHAATLLGTDLYRGRLQPHREDPQSADPASRVIGEASRLVLADADRAESETSQTSAGRLQAITDLVGSHADIPTQGADTSTSHSYPIVPLSLSEAAFPKVNENERASEASDYTRLWKAS